MKVEEAMKLCKDWDIQNLNISLSPMESGVKIYIGNHINFIINKYFDSLLKSLICIVCSTF